MARKQKKIFSLIIITQTQFIALFFALVFLVSRGPCVSRKHGFERLVFTRHVYSTSPTHQTQVREMD